jgi:NTP pyrophosphatase (non-canonical NTP hydrolase)
MGEDLIERGMQNIPAEKIYQDIENFISERDWDQFHSVKNLAMALSVECSELVEIVQWLKEEDTNQIKNDPEKIGKVRDELADIFFYLLRLAAKTDTDLGEAILQKLEKNKKKYPVEKSRGSVKKYTEL